MEIEEDTEEAGALTLALTLTMPLSSRLWFGDLLSESSRLDNANALEANAERAERVASQKRILFEDFKMISRLIQYSGY